LNQPPSQPSKIGTGLDLRIIANAAVGVAMFLVLPSCSQHPSSNNRSPIAVAEALAPQPASASTNAAVKDQPPTVEPKHDPKDVLRVMMPETIGGFVIQSAFVSKRGKESIPNGLYTLKGRDGISAYLRCRDSGVVTSGDPTAKAVTVGAHKGDLYDGMAASLGSPKRATTLIKYAEAFANFAPLETRDVVSVERLLVGAHFEDKEIQTLLSAAADIAALHENDPDAALAFAIHIALVRIHDGINADLLAAFEADGIPPEKLIWKVSKRLNVSYAKAEAQMRGARLDTDLEIAAILDVLEDLNGGELGKLSSAEGKRLAVKGTPYSEKAVVMWVASTWRCRLAIDSIVPLSSQDAGSLARIAATDAAKWVDRFLPGGQPPADRELVAHLARLDAASGGSTPPRGSSALRSTGGQ
jgi:hypothetical protein